MKNLKKTLAIVLAFAMVLSMGFSAFAYTDVAEGTKVAEAVGILSNLGIFEGFEDGTFKPDDTVTRAQMAAIICRTLGYEDQAQASKGSTVFDDVPADDWASGYINVAQSLQIVNGYGDGKFGPNDQVTYEQAIKMIVVALGYELDAQAKGGWSTGYLAVAAREGISKGSNGVVGAPAARGTIAVLVYNSLEVRLMDQKSWTPNGSEDQYGKLDETILSQYLGIKKVEGFVESTPFGDYAANGYTADADANIAFASGAEYFEYFDGKLTAYDLDDLEYDASLIANVNDFVGKKVVAYVGEEEDDETGNLMVYAIAEKQGANRVTVLSAAQLVDADEKYGSEDGVIGYREVGASRIQSLDLEATTGVPVYTNFVADGSIKATDELATKAGSGIITLLSNDADNKIDLIFITSYLDEAVIEEVTTDDGVVMFDCYTSYTLEDIDTDDEDVLNIVIKDGVVADATAIAANDTVSVVEAGDNFNIYYVSSKTITGKVDSYNDDAVEIGGEEYELSAFADYNNTSDLSGKEGIFFLNVDGQIAHDEADASKGNYAVVIAAGEGSGLGAGKVVEVVLADGTSATYSLKDSVIVNGTKTDDDAVVTALQAKMSATENGGKRAKGADIDADLVFELTVKDGKITKLESVSQDGAADGKEYDEENMSYGNLSFNESTIVMSLEAEATEEVQADDFKVGKITDFFVDGEGEDYDLVAYDYDNNDIAGLVIGRGLSTTIPQDGAAFVVTGYKTKDIDGDDAYVLKGFQAGKAVSYTLYNEDETFTEADFAKGNVLLLGVASADGMVSDYELLYKKGSATLENGIANKEDEYYYFGALDETQAPTNSKFYLATGYDEEIDDAANAYVAADGVIMRNSANYTLVDFSESSTPEVSKKSKGTGLFSRYASEYDYKIFVRYFEDAQVEVIVYRYAAPQA